MSESTITHIFGPEDAQHLARARDFDREPAGEGYFLDVGMFAKVPTITAVTGDGRRLATVVEAEGTWYLAYHQSVQLLPTLRFADENDAVAWLVHLADLHTGAVK